MGCGRRPIDNHDADANLLSDWVGDCWKKEEIIKASDPKLEEYYARRKWNWSSSWAFCITHNETTG